MADPSGASAAALYNQGVQLYRAGRAGEAAKAYERALALAPRLAPAWSALGVLKLEAGDAAAAEQLQRRAIELEAGNPEFHNNLGLALDALGLLPEAIVAFDRALALEPRFVEVWSNRGVTLHAMRRPVDALASFDRALALEPGDAFAWSNRGLALATLQRYEDALASLDKATRLQPRYAEAWANRGAICSELQRHVEACAAFGQAAAIDPGLDDVLASLLHAKMRICDWDGLARGIGELLEGVAANTVSVDPFKLLATPAAPELLKRAAVRRAARKCPAAPTREAQPHRSDGRIRLGYFSADFWDHPTMVLAAELFERHDRSRFDIVAVSFGPPRRDAVRERAVAAFERFIEVDDRDDAGVAALARELELDIAVDLMGHTDHARPGVFGHRAAPVQAAFLGYPGTTGMSCIDYLVADAVVVPADAFENYTEQVVWLPDSYQPNPGWRPTSAPPPSRADSGLPETGFVFCCFNGAFKITPDAFDAWMRILQRSPGSVLWLLESHPAATANLRREAERRGIAADRLIFASRVAHAEHRRRLALADLFLDTLHYGAHTTASDALHAGVPVLTRLGDTFASRVAASLLQAVGLPELVTADLDAYERLAVALASDPPRLTGFKRRLADSAATAPLFDVGRYTAGLEAAWEAMHERRLAGLPPAPLRVPPCCA